MEIAEDGGKTRTYRAGDTFVMKPRFTGVWRTLETVRKIYVVVSQAVALALRVKDSPGPEHHA